VYKGRELECGVSLGETCVIECCIVWFTDCRYTCSVYKGRDLECGVGLGETCAIECCIVWFTDCRYTEQCV